MKLIFHSFVKYVTITHIANQANKSAHIKTAIKLKQDNKKLVKHRLLLEIDYTISSKSNNSLTRNSHNRCHFKVLTLLLLLLADQGQSRKSKIVVLLATTRLVQDIHKKINGFIFKEDRYMVQTCKHVGFICLFLEM